MRSRGPRDVVDAHAPVLRRGHANAVAADVHVEEPRGSIRRGRNDEPTVGRDAEPRELRGAILLCVPELQPGLAEVEGVRRGEEGNLHRRDPVRDGAHEHAPVVGGGADARHRLAERVAAFAEGSNRRGRVQLRSRARACPRAEHVLPELHEHLADASVGEPDEHAVAPFVERERGGGDAGLPGGDAGHHGALRGDAPRPLAPRHVPEPNPAVPRHRRGELRALRVPRGAVAFARVLSDGVVGTELFPARVADIRSDGPRSRRAIRRRGDDPGGRTAVEVDGPEARADVNLRIGREAQVVHAARVPCERGCALTGGHVEDLNGVHGPLLAHGGEPAPELIERREHALARVPG